MNISILYDNNRGRNSLRAGLGLSCLVDTGTEKILFDTGSHGPTLLYNMNALGVDPCQIGTVVISHIDSDHTGGLFKFLENNPDVRVFVPHSFPRPFKDIIVLHGARVIDIKTPLRICPGTGTTGEIGDGIKEQSLIMRNDDKLVLLIGDAHPGILKILERVQKLLGMKISLIAGGFHLEGYSETELTDLARRFKCYGIERVAAFHSSGDTARQVFATDFGDGYIESGVGTIIYV